MKSEWNPRPKKPEWLDQFPSQPKTGDPHGDLLGCLLSAVFLGPWVTVVWFFKTIDYYTWKLPRYYVKKLVFWKN